jgi:hypothetical protein
MPTGRMIFSVGRSGVNPNQPQRSAKLSRKKLKY